MLNFGIHNAMIPSFYSNLCHNFNHLMYADDLILITRASRLANRNLKLCLSISSRLTGQLPNLAKSQIYFPSRFNKKVSKSICSILNLNPASFPFIYLGILISPKRIDVASFRTMIDKISRTYNRLNSLMLSPASKTVLINSTLLSIPTYNLSVYPIPDTILSKITKIVSRFFFFFWGKGCNGKGIHNVAWSCFTHKKTEGALVLETLL